MNNKKSDRALIPCTINKKQKKLISQLSLNFLIWLSHKFNLFSHFLNILAYKPTAEISLKLFKSYTHSLFWHVYTFEATGPGTTANGKSASHPYKLTYNSESVWRSFTSNQTFKRFFYHLLKAWSFVLFSPDYSSFHIYIYTCIHIKIRLILI